MLDNASTIDGNSFVIHILTEAFAVDDVSLSDESSEIDYSRHPSCSDDVAINMVILNKDIGLSDKSNLVVGKVGTYLNRT